LSKSAQILVPFDRIGQKKTKRRFPLARVEGTILQFFPGLWLASYNSAVLSLARKAKTLVVILGRCFLWKQLSSETFFSFFIYFLSFLLSK
jgi:hypothetical protein